MAGVSPSTFYGFHFKSDGIYGDSEVRNKLNKVNAESYIPLFSMARGIQKLVGVAKKGKDYPVKVKAAIITRGVVEASGLGCLLVVPDVIVTIVRHYSDKKTTSDSNQGSFSPRDSRSNSGSDRT